jgi:hypothetical protein
MPSPFGFSYGDGDPSHFLNGSGSFISASSVTLTGPITISGCATITGSLSVGNFSTGGYSLTLPASTSVRERLSGSRVYYVRTDGNDSNNGLANTSGGALLTMQKAVDNIAALDLNGYDATIQVSAGTYAATVTLKNAVGAGDIYITGDTTTPTNVVIDGKFVKSNSGTKYIIKGFKLIKSTSSATIAFDVTQGAYVTFGNIQFSTGWTDHVYCAYRGYVQAVSNYEIAASASSSHLNIGQGGQTVAAGITITLTGTPAFTQYIACRDLAYALLVSVTYSGSATGSRYVVERNAVVNTAGATLPGNSAGTTGTGGIYA